MALNLKLDVVNNQFQMVITMLPPTLKVGALRTQQEPQ
jgi:hypothetical protein